MPRRLLFVVNVDWFFLSHRLPIALAAKANGFDVAVTAAETGSGEEIRDNGIAFYPLAVSRSRTSVSSELHTIYSLYRRYRLVKPHIVHHVTLKPVIYGSLAARGLRDTHVVNALSGLGYTFIDPKRSPATSTVVRALLKTALSHRRSRAIFQNPDDMQQFVTNGWISSERADLIQGSGVDCERFSISPEPDGPPVIMLPARLLRDKGVVEFVEAARILRGQGVQGRFVLVGEPDLGNPATIKPAKIAKWVAEGIVEAWGHSNDMPRTLSESRIVVLPSYREGLPKVLLEAAACGRAIVTTDVPGCRHAVVNEQTGLIVPPRAPIELANAILRLLRDDRTRLEMGMAGRRRVEAELSVERIVAQTLAVYDAILRGHPRVAV